MFRSQNGGDSWERFDTGVPDIGWAAGVVGDENSVFLGASSGFYRLHNATTSVQNNFTETPSLSIAPNPMRGSGHITYRVPKATNVRISLINTLGQVIAILHDAAQSVGEHSLSLDASHYPAGVYMIQMETLFDVRTCPLVIGSK